MHYIMGPLIICVSRPSLTPYYKVFVSTKVYHIMCACLLYNMRFLVRSLDELATIKQGLGVISSLRTLRFGI